jgi:hypothetical protein
MRGEDPLPVNPINEEQRDMHINAILIATPLLAGLQCHTKSSKRQHRAIKVVMAALLGLR